MFKMLSKKINNKKGFTLIELIVVIAILGILAAIAIPRLGGFTDSAKESGDKVLAAGLKDAFALERANGNITLTGSVDIVIPTDAKVESKDITQSISVTADQGISEEQVKEIIIEYYPDFEIKSTRAIKITINGQEGEITSELQ